MANIDRINYLAAGGYVLLTSIGATLAFGHGILGHIGIFLFVYFAMRFILKLVDSITLTMPAHDHGIVAAQKEKK